MIRSNAILMERITLHEKNWSLKRFPLNKFSYTLLFGGYIF